MIGLAALMNIVGRFLGRELYGVPLNIILQYLVPVVAVPRPDALQVRQASRLYPRSDRLERQTAHLLRSGTGPRIQQGVLEVIEPRTLAKHDESSAAPCILRIAAGARIPGRSDGAG